MADQAYKPALRFPALTALFDPVVAVTTRERSFKARVLERAALAPGEEVLDMGCGTGTLALAALAAEPAARVTGLDADPEVLARARRKAAGARVELDLDEGFSTELPYDDGRFDAVLSTLFFHHLEDVDKRRTAAEALRVLRPGGRLVVGDLGRSQDPLMRVAVLGTVQLLDGFATTSASVAGKLPAMLAEAGLAEVRVTDRLRTPTGTIEVITGRAARLNG
ncbi:MAG: methyltransferase domain-containing protein [Thermoleophilaceae bacterium]